MTEDTPFLLLLPLDKVLTGLDPAALWDEACPVHPLAVRGRHRIPEPAQGVVAVPLIDVRRSIAVGGAGDLDVGTSLGHSGAPVNHSVAVILAIPPGHGLGDVGLDTTGTKVMDGVVAGIAERCGRDNGANKGN